MQDIIFLVALIDLGLIGVAVLAIGLKLLLKD